MNKILLILFCVLFTNLYSQTATPPDSGDGSVGDPYQIATLENLFWISAADSVVTSPNRAYRWTKYYIQTADIDASATSSWNGNAGWDPIGNSGTNFTGSYNGDGYKISNLHINRPLTDYAGLFGYTYGSLITNLSLENVDISGKARVGGLIGTGTYSTTITNCSSSGSVTGTGSVGALVGYGFKLTITNSHSSGTVSGTSTYIGGLVGLFLSSPNSVTNCYSTASVSGGTQGTGGLVGRCDGTTISSSYSTGTVSGTGNFYGGLVGTMTGFSSVINNSYSTGTVSGTGSYNGGLVGYLGGTVTNSYSAGNVSGSSTSGGFVGSNLSGSTITNCYSIGSVSGNTVVGGFAGTNPGTISASFWNTDVRTNGYGTNSGTFNAVGKTTSEMKTQSTFTDAGWDFIVEVTNGTNDYWEMNSEFNSGYPILEWQSVEVPDITTTPNIVSSSNIGFTAQSGSVSLSFVEKNSIPTNLPGEAVTINKYWEVSDVTGGNVKLRLYYLTALTASFTGTPKIIHYNGSSWEVLPTETEVTVGLLKYVETTNYYSSFSPVTIGDDDSPLPVELTTFTAKLANNKVNLTWQTATEVNNYGFQVERSMSEDQNEAGWESIGFVNGNGNSNSAKSYSFIDASAPVSAGKVYYRLKQIDTDGQFEYSNVIEVNTLLPVEFNLAQNYPNPFNPTTRIDYQLPVSGKVRLELFDITGSSIAVLFEGDLEAGYHSTDVQASSFGLSSGMYIYRLKVISQGKSPFMQTKKLLLLK